MAYRNAMLLRKTALSTTHTHALPHELHPRTPLKYAGPCMAHASKPGMHVPSARYSKRSFGPSWLLDCYPRPYRYHLHNQLKGSNFAGPAARFGVRDGWLRWCHCQCVLKKQTNQTRRAVLGGGHEYMSMLPTCVSVATIHKTHPIATLSGLTTCIFAQTSTHWLATHSDRLPDASTRVLNNVIVP